MDEKTPREGGEGGGQAIKAGGDSAEGERGEPQHIQLFNNKNTITTTTASTSKPPPPQLTVPLNHTNTINNKKRAKI